MSASPTIYDVAIIGYGPVGATLANLLSTYGLRLVVVEQAADIYDKPRAITLDHEALRTFQACGIAETMERGTAPHNGTHYLGVDGEVIKIFDPMPPPYPLGWVPTATFVQPETERALRAAFARYAGGEVLLSTRVTGIAQDADRVTLMVAGEGGERSITARYAVACDGANSFVRKSLGIRLDDLAFDEWWMVVDALAGDLGKRPAKCFQYCWPSRPGTFVPGPGALRRWEIKLLPGERPEDFATDDKVMAVLGTFTDTTDLTLWRAAVYRFHALLAQRWRDGRILLMGDAVHQTPPFLGQGLCAGLRDAFNLAWKLAFVLAGKADQSLLDTYETERKPHVTAMVALAKAFGVIIGELDPEAAKARDARLREELRSGRAETIRQKFVPDLTDGLIAKDAPLAGGLFVQPHILCADGARVRMDDLLAPTFAIVAADAAPFVALSQTTRTQWRTLGGELVMVVPHQPASSPDGVRVLVEDSTLFADWLDRNGVVAAVVRPDRAVYGAVTDAAALDGLVARLLHELKA